MSLFKRSEVVALAQRLDPFLIQATQKLQGYVEVIETITDRKLTIQRFVPDKLQITITVTIVTYISNALPGHYMAQANTRQERYNIQTKTEALRLFECISVFNHKLRDVIFKELELRKSLKDKSSTLDRKIKKLTELHASVNEFSVIIDKILAFYSGQDMGFFVDGLPTADELNNAKRKLSDIKKSLKHNELHDLFSQYNAEFITNETSILCATVGIDESYGEILFKMDEDLRMHQTDLYYLEKIIENQAYKIEAMEESTGHGREALMKNLHSFGFTTECCKTIVNNIEDDFVDLQSPLYWGLRYLRHAFQHHPLLTEHSRYIYQNDNMDSWFEEIINVGEDPESEENVVTQKSVSMINISCTPGEEDKVEKKLKEEEEIHDSLLFYHGTTHESAKSIIEDGITLSKGQDCQDFSSGDGFYVSEKFENAKKWSRAAQGQHQAVIVYRIKKQQFDAANGLDLMSSKKEWEEIISLCRNGYKNKALKKRLLKDVDYVRGPMCKNPKAVVLNKKAPSGFGRDDDTQVCLRSDNFAEEFGSLANIVCVIFY